MKKNQRKKEIFSTFSIPFLFVITMWIVKFIELYFDASFISFGVYPKNFNGLKGIIFSPFIHADFSHLIHNSYPIFILGGMLYFFYKEIANKILLWLFFISGFWLWVLGGNVSGVGYHIGASGIIYALASFIFFSGLIRKNPKLSAASLVVVFLYGSLFWSLLYVKIGVSWEGHLCGFLAGILIAIYYKNEGPKPKKYQWEIDEELEKNRENLY